MFFFPADYVMTMSALECRSSKTRACHPLQTDFMQSCVCIPSAASLESTVGIEAGRLLCPRAIVLSCLSRDVPRAVIAMIVEIVAVWC